MYTNLQGKDKSTTGNPFTIHLPHTLSPLSVCQFLKTFKKYQVCQHMYYLSSITWPMKLQDWLKFTVTANMVDFIKSMHLSQLILAGNNYCMLKCYSLLFILQEQFDFYWNVTSESLSSENCLCYNLIELTVNVLSILYKWIFKRQELHKLLI